MIAQIMKYCNNHFWRSYERNNFAIVEDGITGTFTETYLAGQYIHIVDSYLNDGVYKITAVSSVKLTLDATLIAEDTDDYITVYGCKVPSDFLSLVTDIETWQTKNSGLEGVASESIDSYSVSFASGIDGLIGNTWQNAFKSRLSTYRAMYERWC